MMVAEEAACTAAKKEGLFHGHQQDAESSGLLRST